MKDEIIKQAFKLGNSAGVLLPVEWNGRKVAIKLIDKSISREIFEILDEKKLLSNTIGIFLAGSYARGEETETSDIDVLIVTDAIDRQIKKGKYEIILVSKNKFGRSIVRNLYLASLVNEAKAILNDDLLKHYRNKAKRIFVKKNLQEIKSITKINKKSVEIDEKTGQKVSDGILYSLVLRLRELYLIECLKYGKNPSTHGFISLIKKIASEEPYKAYLRIKNDLKPKKIISIKEAKVLIDEINKRIKNLEHGKKE